MTGLLLHKHVSFGLVASRPVFLDLKRDRYLALDRLSEAAFLSLLRGEAIAPSDRERLLATGLFRPGEQSAELRPAAYDGAEASLLDEPRERPSLLLALGLHRSTSRAHRRLARRPLLSLLDSTKQDAREPAANDADELRTRCRRFLAARPLVPIAPKCLPDSLVLREWLASAGVRPALVFGVRMDPFGAHCWLQSGGLVLNDAVDRISAFTPVLVLE